MFTTRPTLTGTFGMVASTHWLASASGMAVLEAGGNAFDAAVAAGLVLQVVHPHLNGPGGEVPIIGCTAPGGRPRDGRPRGSGAGPDDVFVINGQGPAPLAADIAHFEGLGLDLVPGTGLLAACVPGAFAAWLELLARYGTMRLGQVLDYAIGYAEKGYPLAAGASAAVATVENLFRSHWPTSARVYLADGGIPPAGRRFTNPDLAATYKRILAEAERSGSDREAQIEGARRAFYQGFVAEAFTAYFAHTEAMDTSGIPHGGLLTSEDLGRFRARVERPVTFDYRGRTVCKTGPWGQGPVFAQQLALLRGFDLDDTDPTGDELIHLVVECAKLAFADREAFYGDPDFTDVPLDALLSAGYNDDRRRLVGDTAATDLRPGRPDGAVPRLPPGAGATRAPRTGPEDAGVGEPTVAISGGPRGDTCHVDVADRWGNMVAATPSGGWLQSSPVIPGLGFGATTRGQMFWLTEGLPNSLAGGKRPRTTLSPTLVLRDGRPHLAFGTPGGDQQDQWSLVFFLRHVHHGMELQEAIDAATWHTTHFPSSFYPRNAHPGRIHVESRVGGDTLARLQARGHEVVVEEPWSLGRLSAVGRRDDGMLRAAANPRGMQGYAAGR